MKFPVLIFLLFISTLIASGNKPEKVFDEQLRPQFHFTPEINWMNKPGGLVFYKGEYHMFYQYNPMGNVEGSVHWGHAISTDLVHWEPLPIALYPENDSISNDESTELSGSGIVDENNVAGLQSGDEKTIILFYTSQKSGLRLSYSNDKGRSWKMYDKNPIVAFDETANARDPKVFRHEKSNQFVMLLCKKPNENERQKGISFYTSENLIDWTFKSHIAGFSESPDMVELPVNRREDDKKWVLFDGDGSYLIGTFDGEKFNSESPKMQSDYGKNFFGNQTWSNIPAADGRTIQIASMKDGEFPKMPFNGQMTFPCELSLKKFTDGIRLIRKPVKEIEMLHEKGEIWENKNLIPGINKNLTKGVKGDCLHITGSFKLINADNFGFYVRLDKDLSGMEIMYNSKKNTLSCLGESVFVEPVDGVIKLDILLDRSSVEIFANDGKVAMSSCFVPIEDAYGVYLFNMGGELGVEKLEIYPIKSIWETEK